MTRCKDGRKHVIVSGYQKKTGMKMSSYERSCPTSTSKPHDDQYICCVCGEECSNTDTRNIEVKGETKTICNECVDTVHGLM
jgi:hypothetical protein